MRTRDLLRFVPGLSRLVRSLDTRRSGSDVNDEVGQLRRAFNRLLDRVADGVAIRFWPSSTMVSGRGRIG